METKRKWTQFLRPIFDLCLSHSPLYLKIVQIQFHMSPSPPPTPPTPPFPPPDIYFGLKDTWSLNKMYPFVYQKFLEISYHEDTKIHDIFFEVRRKS